MSNHPELSTQKSGMALFFSDQLRLCLFLASLVVLLAGLKAASAFFVPVFLAFFIATVSFPIMGWLQRQGCPRWLAVFLTCIADFGFIAGLVVVVVALLGELQNKWDDPATTTGDYKALLEEKVKDASGYLEHQLTEWGVENASETVNEYFQTRAIDQLNQVDLREVWSLSTDVVGKVAMFFGTMLTVTLLTIFMLSEARLFSKRLEVICEASGPNLARFYQATKEIQRFLGIKTLVSLGTGILAGFLCWAADLDFYILWGILAFALNYIPVIGSIIAGIPPCILALILYGWPQATAVAVGYVSINVLIGNFVEPMLLGRRFGLPTLVVLGSVVFWGWIWGPVGMLLAVPLTMLLKVGMMQSKEFQWIALLISVGDENPDADYEGRLLTNPEKLEADEMGAPEGAVIFNKIRNARN